MSGRAEPPELPSEGPGREESTRPNEPTGRRVNGFAANLAARALHPAGLVRPRLASHFEPSDAGFPKTATQFDLAGTDTDTDTDTDGWLDQGADHGNNGLHSDDGAHAHVGLPVGGDFHADDAARMVDGPAGRGGLTAATENLAEPDSSGRPTPTPAEHTTFMTHPRSVSPTPESSPAPASGLARAVRSGTDGRRPASGTAGAASGPDPDADRKPAAAGHRLGAATTFGSPGEAPLGASPAGRGDGPDVDGPDVRVAGVATSAAARSAAMTARAATVGSVAAPNGGRDDRAYAAGGQFGLDAEQAAAAPVAGTPTTTVAVSAVGGRVTGESPGMERDGHDLSAPFEAEVPGALAGRAVVPRITRAARGRSDRAAGLSPSRMAEPTATAGSDARRMGGESAVLGVVPGPSPNASWSAPAPEPESPAEAGLTVHVSIGRVEVRATQPAARRPAREPGRQAPVMTLGEYLERRRGGAGR